MSAFDKDRATGREGGTDERAPIAEDLRKLILREPDVILDDQDVMRALVDARDKAQGANVVDLRGIAMERLETRLVRLEDTHRSVIAAAYENLAGTNMIQRAVLRMLDPVDFESFLRDLTGEVADILRVDALRLVLETVQSDEMPAVRRLDGVLSVAGAGFIEAYLDGGPHAPERPVTLRASDGTSYDVYGSRAPDIRSEACLRLDFGTGRLPGLLVLGSSDPHQFTPQHGTDLLAFFAGVFERSMRRWLS
ncbi:DUF484 family protein [Profundibacterium mesophilum]|uniref:Recombinase XerC n=1 Tax=Profundibacterium mesophilum KAUST100406-0324 TaxID=1037889 RepID=A0A921NYB3_9RHOB|nr:DUF484 family protein [Profundibacterium mesophilum]KAF0675728.1 hypothetical protein PMES_01814 [Profundibacterium mesophilum KAUST100406-0324]